MNGAGKHGRRLRSGEGAALGLALFASPAKSASWRGVTPYPWSDVLVIAGLILINGLF